MEDKKSTMAVATDMMIQAMQKLIAGEMAPEVATAVALNGKTIVDAAREATNFAKATGYIPVDGAFGKNILPLEPHVTKEAMAEQRIRLENMEVKTTPAARASRWCSNGEFV